MFRHDFHPHQTICTFYECTLKPSTPFVPIGPPLTPDTPLVPIGPAKHNGTNPLVIIGVVLFFIIIALIIRLGFYLLKRYRTFRQAVIAANRTSAAPEPSTSIELTNTPTSDSTQSPPIERTSTDTDTESTHGIENENFLPYDLCIGTRVTFSLKYAPFRPHHFVLNAEELWVSWLVQRVQFLTLLESEKERTHINALSAMDRAIQKSKNDNKKNETQLRKFSIKNEISQC